MDVLVGNENTPELVEYKQNKAATATATTAKSTRRNGLYLSNKELTDFNLGRNKFGAQLSLNDIVNNSNSNNAQSKVTSFEIHEDKPRTQMYNDPLIEEQNEDDDNNNDDDEEEEDEDDDLMHGLTTSFSNNSASTINKRSSIPYVSNRYSTTSSHNGSSVRNSKRFSLMSSSSSESDINNDEEEDEDFNMCFFNNASGRMRNLTSISIHSNSSNESVGFVGSSGGKPGLAGFDATAPERKKSIKKVKQQQQQQQQQQQRPQQMQPPQQHHRQQRTQQQPTTKRQSKRFSQISSTSEKRQSVISGSSDKNPRYSQISSTSSERSSKRLSVMSLLRQHQPEPQKPAPFLSSITNTPQNQSTHAQQQQQQQQQQQSISQPSSSKIHRLMHSVSIRSGLFKLKDSNQPEEKKVQMKRSFFSIRSGLNRSASSMDMNGNHFDRNSISLPVPQDQTLKKLDSKLKNSSSIYSLAASQR